MKPIQALFTKADTMLLYYYMHKSMFPALHGSRPKATLVRDHNYIDT